MGHTTNLLLILSRDAESYSEIIHDAHLPDLKISAFDSVNRAQSNSKEANILFGDPDLLQQLLPAMERPEWVQSTWAGVNLLTIKGCRRDYLLTGVKDVFGPMMAEYVICYMLMHERGALRRYSLQLKKQWDHSSPGLLRNKRVGIMGVGSIGGAIASTAKFFSMYTSGYSRDPYPREFIDIMFGQDQLLEFVHDLDYLISVLPHTPDTAHIINSSLFKAMKKDALFINVGRGSVVDESALIDALNRNEIAGAVLDVFEQEPLPQSHPFWNTPGVIITSHTAALSSPRDIAPLFIENYRRFVMNRPLKYQINFDRGY